MNKKLFIIFLAIILIVLPAVLFAEDISITTYYPAPYGVYQQLQVGTATGAGTLNVGVAGGPASTINLFGTLNINGTRLGLRSGFFNYTDNTLFNDQWVNGNNIGANRPCIAFLELIKGADIAGVFVCDLRGAGCQYETATGFIRYYAKSGPACTLAGIDITCRYLCFD